MALHDIIKPTYVRLLHKNGRFAANFDYQRGIVQFVDRGGTIEYDLVALAEQVRQHEPVNVVAQGARGIDGAV